MATDLLQKAFAEAGHLSEQEQDALAVWLLAELSSEARWAEAFRKSEDLLGGLADEALQEHREGRTQPLVPEQL